MILAMPVSFSLFLSLLSHQWKQSTRSSYFEKGMLLRIFIGIMMLYLAINLVVMGLFMNKILAEVFPFRRLLPHSLTGLHNMRICWSCRSSF